MMEFIFKVVDIIVSCIRVICFNSYIEFFLCILIWFENCRGRNGYIKVDFCVV